PGQAPRRPHGPQPRDRRTDQDQGQDRVEVPRLEGTEGQGPLEEAHLKASPPQRGAGFFILWQTPNPKTSALKAPWPPCFPATSRAKPRPSLPAPWPRP